MDLMERLDRAIPDGPAHRPVEELLISGRSVVRRRRAATVGGVALLTACVVGGTALALGGPNRPDRGAPPAADTTGIERPAAGVNLPVVPVDTTVSACILQMPVEPGQLPIHEVRCHDGIVPPLVFVDGRLYRASDNIVVQRLIRHVNQTDAAAIVEEDGQTRWLYVSPGTRHYTEIAVPADDDFAEWAASGPTLRLDDSPSGAGSTVASAPDYHLTPEGIMVPAIAPSDAPVRYDGQSLVAKDGATITQRIPDAPYSTNAVPPGSTAEAVTVQTSEGTWFVRGYVASNGDTDLLTEPAGLRADNLPAWVDAINEAQSSSSGAR